MKYLGLAGTALLATTAMVQAGGLDRSGQPIGAIFAEDGATVLSFGVVMPSVTGTDSTGAAYDVGETYTQFGFSYTNSLSDSLSYALILDQPYGAAINYGTDPLTTNLGGTMADLTSQAATFVMRYSFGPRFSVYGGVSFEGIQADVALNGISYRNAISTAAVTRGFNGTLPNGTPQLETATLGAALAGSGAAQGAIDSTYGAGTFATLAGQFGTQATAFAANGGYDFSMETDYSLGYLIGAAYEIPDIALRLAVTYRFETEHSAATTENMFGMTLPSSVNYVAPQSLNIDFQTGIAQDTLLTAGFRWTEFSAVDLIPTLLGADLVNLDDSYRYSLGVARRFNDNFAGSLTLTYEPEGDGATVSPLGPTDGQFGITLGGRYTDGNMSISGGINYTWLGDAFAGVADQPVASFTGSTALGVGLRTEFTF